ncbi:Aldo_ket_red domain-containing protein [Meloidogyne graminicola]|uniref:Aldo_ket_red domain-containing protein n=1 Tax=Meloidogyne graminicola TaxID=189291 RepID=A0A8T0A321_9BILA|nr:Aldo_ket_red domain-containing protein [Meloidogyne graminicola]
MTTTNIQKTEGGPKILLNSGNLIPLIGLGTYKIVDQTLMDSSVDTALKCGYRFFDTAKLYQNEKQLGNSLEKLLPKYKLKREDIFLLTKFSPFSAEKATEEIPKLIEESLKNLKTSYIDLVLIHCPKPDENDNNDKNGNSASRRINWQTLEKIPVEKVHSIGVSNYEVRHLEEMADYSNKKPSVNQIEFHPHFRRNDIREFCKKEGIHLQASKSLNSSIY